ncbi:MAG: hypothetical protein JF586_04125 [Burkholderiales bacterium]|nr:hypothetical protein [Burkholderiales bacterium]
MGKDFGRDVEHEEMILLFERIVGEVLKLQAKVDLLRTFGAEPELWLRNEIALNLHQVFGAHVRCEAKYAGSTQRLDLHIVQQRQVYCIELKVEDRNSSSMIKPLVADAKKLMHFVPEAGTDKPMMRCLLGVAVSDKEGAKLASVASSDIVPNPARVFRQQGGMAVTLVALDQRRPPVSGNDRRW